METLARVLAWCLDSPLALAFVLLAGGLIAGGDGRAPRIPARTAAPAPPPSS